VGASWHGRRWTSSEARLSNERENGTVVKRTEEVEGMLIVVAAIIEHDGKLLVCQRRRGGAFELQWEFPGGKVHAGESLEAALVRELQEELNVSAQIGREVYRTRHHYAQMADPVELVFFTAEAAPDQIQNRVFERIEWRAPDTLKELPFLEADRELIELLASGKLKL
jgi:8-oxo-dGTP diphosphatase